MSPFILYPLLCGYRPSSSEEREGPQTGTAATWFCEAVAQHGLSASRVGRPDGCVCSWRRGRGRDGALCVSERQSAVGVRGTGLVCAGRGRLRLPWRADLEVDAALLEVLGQRGHDRGVVLLPVGVQVVRHHEPGRQQRRGERIALSNSGTNTSAASERVWCGGRGGSPDVGLRGFCIGGDREANGGAQEREAAQHATMPTHTTVAKQLALFSPRWRGRGRRLWRQPFPHLAVRLFFTRCRVA